MQDNAVSHLNRICIKTLTNETLQSKIWPKIMKAILWIFHHSSLTDMQVLLSTEFYNFYEVTWLLQSDVAEHMHPFSLKLLSQNMFHVTWTNNLCKSAIHTYTTTCVCHERNDCTKLLIICQWTIQLAGSPCMIFCFLLLRIIAHFHKCEYVWTRLPSLSFLCQSMQEGWSNGKSWNDGSGCPKYLAIHTC
jgi:hypothetical protein